MLLITDDYRFFRRGQRIRWKNLSEDELNYYLHGWSDEYPVGCHRNYLVLPKFCAKRMED